MIKVGCAGYPIGQQKYQDRFNMVEVTGLLDKFPRATTLEKWRYQAPKQFEFISVAPKDITHPEAKGKSQHTMVRLHHKVGYFQESAQVRKATQQMLATTECLKSKILLFTLPGTFLPSADNIGRMQRYFQWLPKKDFLVVWEPPLSWPHSLIGRVSHSLRISAAFNPLAHKTLPAFPVHYFRLGTPRKSKGLHKFTDMELRNIKRACTGKINYVIFNNGPTSFIDALTFTKLL